MLLYWSKLKKIVNNKIERKLRQCSYSIATRPEKTEKVKTLISIFREKLAKELDYEGATDIYTYSIQLFPLTKDDTFWFILISHEFIGMVQTNQHHRQFQKT